MPATPVALHRVGHLLVFLLAGVTGALFVAGSDYAWLGLGATGIALLCWAFVDVGIGARVRAVMAAAGVACSLFGLAPMVDLLGSHLG